MCPAPDRHGVQLVNVLKALAPRYAVDVLTLRAGTMPFNERFLKTRMLRVPVVGSLAEQVELFRRAIRRQLEGEEYDVVHLRSAWGGRAVLAASPARLVYEVARSTEGEPRAADAALSEQLAQEEQLCLERADLVLVATDGARQELMERGIHERVAVVPPGVDVDHFDWEPPPGDEALPRVLFAGKIGGGRGVRLLLRAIARVKAQRPVKLVLAGALDDGFRPSFDAARAEAGLDESDVELLGAIEHDDMPRVIAQATLCVAPSALGDERPLATFPTKLLEYLACRRAVVAPRRRAVAELITDGELGLLFTPGDEADLARAIAQLLDDGPARERMAEAGYQRVRAAHPASATRRRLLEAYARLLPATTWAPPTRALSPIDALPSHPDTTTARRPLPPELLDGRVAGEHSGEIHIDDDRPTGQIAVQPGEVVIEFDAPFAELEDEPAGLMRWPLADPFADAPQDVTSAIVVEPQPLGFAAGDDDATQPAMPRPLPPQKFSG